MKALYLQGGFVPGSTRPSGRYAADTYVPDPAKPVPYQQRPVRFLKHQTWQRWLVTGQRSFGDRTDVLTCQTPVLTTPLRISGAPIAELFASTTGTDADWVVKLIDIFPDEVSSRTEMGGYELAVSMDIFRGRFRESFEVPSPIPPGKTQRYRGIVS